MKTELIKAGEQDIEVILEMMKDFNQFFGYDFDPKTRQENLTQFLSNTDLGVIFIVRQESRSIGYIVVAFGYSFEYGGRDAFIDEFFIEENWRNQGVGSSMLRELPDMLKSFKVLAIHLEVERTNYQGQRVYLKSGFKGNDRNILTLNLAN